MPPSPQHQAPAPAAAPEDAAAVAPAVVAPAIVPAAASAILAAARLVVPTKNRTDQEFILLLAHAKESDLLGKGEKDPIFGMVAKTIANDMVPPHTTPRSGPTMRSFLTDVTTPIRSVRSEYSATEGAMHHPTNLKFCSIAITSC